MGFTTDPEDARSTPYAADMAKGFNVPIVHVNADDVEACSAAIRLAMAYRERWGRDIVIDVIGYRRYGHNETDEPAYTQPLIAAKIKAHPPVSEIYAEKLVDEGVVAREDVERDRRASATTEMSAALKDLRKKMELGEYEDPTVTTSATGELDRSASPPVETAVPIEKLRALNEALIKVPESFTIHRKLRKPLAKRIEALEKGGIEFGHAEALAFASLLTEGVHIRLTGQDTERGTFSHRHLVLHDENTGLEYCPMQNLEDANAPFELYNSPLSEIACLGFEYGYSAATPNALVLWEAQYGDFANAGQVIIDSFIVSGEAKWGQTSRLTLLLPHGYEGSGPEHSSARIERFLALAAEGNIRIANPSTAAQYFHLLRRQALIRKPRPLIVFTPKGLLRLDRAAATPEELTEGSFHFILDDPTGGERRDKVERLVLCTGKVYYDIDASERREAAENVAIARVELLYPFAKEQLTELIASYPNLKEIVWAQEEPRNMGCWKVMSRRLPDLLPEGVELELRRPPDPRQPGRGLLGRPCPRAGAHRPHRADARVQRLGARVLSSVGVPSLSSRCYAGRAHRPLARSLRFAASDGGVHPHPTPPAASSRCADASSRAVARQACSGHGARISAAQDEPRSRGAVGAVRRCLPRHRGEISVPRRGSRFHRRQAGGRASSGHPRPPLCIVNSNELR